MATLRDILDRNGLPSNALDHLEYGPRASSFECQVRCALAERVPDIDGLVAQILASDDVETCDSCGNRMGENIPNMEVRKPPKWADETDDAVICWDCYRNEEEDDLLKEDCKRWWGV